jgi:hypothetical protein
MASDTHGGARTPNCLVLHNLVKGARVETSTPVRLSGACQKLQEGSEGLTTIRNHPQHMIELIAVLWIVEPGTPHLINADL